MFSRKKSPAPATSPRSTKPTTEAAIRRAAELWLDIFEATITESVKSATEENYYLDSAKAIVIVNAAHGLADRALDCYQERWPGVRL